MAYSNWGAFVYKNGERQKDCEDVPVFGDRDLESALPSGTRIFANLMKLGGGEGAGGWWEHAHHAVLGRGPVRLAGYKASPELWLAGNPPIREDVPALWADDVTKEIQGTVEVEGKVWQYKASRAGIFKVFQGCYDEAEIIDLLLEEPDGTIWTSRCGYEYGAGWMDQEPDQAWSSKLGTIRRVTGSL